MNEAFTKSIRRFKEFTVCLEWFCFENANHTFGNLYLSEPTPSRRHRRIGSIIVGNYNSAEHEQNQRHHSTTQNFGHSEREQTSLVQKTQLCGVVLTFYKWPVVIPSLQAVFICSHIMMRDGWINDKLLQLYAI